MGLRLPNRCGDALLDTCTPDPGVSNTTPRGELVLKNAGLRLFGEDCASGVPSQLISRRTPSKDPFGPAVVPPPRSTRYASRAGVMAAASAPAPVRAVGAALAAAGIADNATAAVIADNAIRGRLMLCDLHGRLMDCP